MAWVVDSCVLLDIALQDPVFATPSAKLVDKLARYRLVVCPITLVEVSPCFGGSVEGVCDFARRLGCETDWDWMAIDTASAGDAWSKHVMLKRRGESRRRPVADILIGAFAVRAGGLITRNADPFKAVFQTLPLATPEAD